MNRLILLCEDQEDFITARDRFKFGWILDPDIYGGRPLRLENAVVYHLIKYEEGEEPQPETEGKIISIKSVPIAEADKLLKDHYEIADRYAKTVTLIKRDSSTSNPDKE